MLKIFRNICYPRSMPLDALGILRNSSRMSKNPANTNLQSFDILKMRRQIRRRTKVLGIENDIFGGVLNKAKNNIEPSKVEVEENEPKYKQPNLISKESKTFKKSDEENQSLVNSSAHETMRIAKRISKSGISSRREAEKLIKDGFVQVNGNTVSSPALNVSDSDQITVKSKPLLNNIEPSKLWLIHKPKAELVTRNDPKNRPCLMSRMKDVGLSDSLKPVGRLDFMSEGLILLTNDGDLSRKLEHPNVGLRRVYRVRVFGSVTKEKIRAMQKGCFVDGVKYKGMGISIDRGEGNNVWLVVQCTEGKNNQIRRVFKHMNLTVNRLIRTAYGPFKLGKLMPGGICEARLQDYFIQKVNNAMETGKPIHSPMYQMSAIKRSNLVPRSKTTVKKTAIKPTSIFKGSVKRGRGGGINSRLPKANPRNEIRDQQKKKKLNKTNAWKKRSAKQNVKQAITKLNK
mmetsp:Transcript_17187/g.25448  ORF Transcript_17187/g.25448 Transcript_17187/m.25448 type:complete len:458 (+) Transcript_17187:181-1554(+)